MDVFLVYGNARLRILQLVRYGLCMSSVLEVKKETAQKLLFLAKNEGVSVDELLRIYVPGLGADSPVAVSNSSQQAEAFLDWAESHRDELPLLSDDAVSRRSIYNE